MKPALLVIDVQKQFFRGDAIEPLNDAVAQINAAIALFREKDYSVIAIQNVNAKENLVPGEEGFELPDALNILPSDLNIHKSYTNSFNKTPLADNLRELGVDTVIVTGYSAVYCVLSGYRGAQDVDLNALVLLGAIASPVPEQIKMVEDITHTITLDDLKEMLA